ncbi:MAG: hypothetical protein AB7G13_07625 [Lautropia sp.]
MGWMPYVIVGVTLAAALVIEARAWPKDDVAWLVYVAANWLDGHAPYDSLIEVNTPPIIWLTMGAVLIARVVRLPELAIAPAYYGLFVIGCAWLTASILQSRALPVSRGAAFATLGLVLLVPALPEFGQREHLIIAAALPLLALHVESATPARPDSRVHALLAGALAGLCCGIKPHFLLAFVLATAATAVTGRRVPWLAVIVAILTQAILFGLTLLLAPAYLDQIVPMAMELYVPALSGSLFPNASLPAMAVSIVLAGLWWSNRSRLQDGGAVLVLLAFAFGCWLVYFIQDKGWPYHRLPASMAVLLAAIVWGKACPRRFTRGTSYLLVAVLLAGALAERVKHVAERIALAVQPDRAPQVRVAEFLREAKASSYASLSLRLSGGFPLVQKTGLAWGSRFPSVWALLAEAERDSATAASAPGESVSRMMAEDFLDHCPEFVSIDHTQGVDYPALIAEGDPRFGVAWRHYTLVATIEPFEIHRRPAGRPVSEVCGP